MEPVQAHISSLQSKLQLLLRRMGTLQKENDQLTQELRASREAERALTERISDLELQLGILKASTEKLQGAQKVDFEKRIQKFIKDLDRCIAILNT